MELDDAAWALLHELRLRGSTTTARREGRGDGDERGGRGELATATVEVLVARGYAIRKPRAVMITATGRAAHTAWARVEPGSAREADLHVAYERFLPLNAEFIRVCHDWQVHAGGDNDHTDLEYDWAVIDRLHRVHERLSPLGRAMSRSEPRFVAYRGRLSDALARIEEGDTDWFTSPRLDSYHTVWMQLHEDLLLALGIERSSEGPTDAEASA
jgi:hypothetical protein